MNVTQILQLLVFSHESLLNLFYFDVQGVDVTFQPAVLRLQPTFLRIICGLKQKNDTRPFFSRYPLLCPTKDTPLKLRCKYETKPSDNFLPPTISPWITKKETQKKVSEEGILFCLAHSAALFSAPGRQKAVHYIQSRGHFFIDRNNGISYCSGAPVIQVEFIQEVCRGSWRMKGRSPCQAGRERWMEEEGEGGGIGGSPWAPFPFGEGGRVVVFVFLPASVSEITSAVIALKPAGREPHGVHQVSVMSIQAVRINTPFACLSHLGAYSRSKAFKRKGFFFFASLLFCYALWLFLSPSLSPLHS